MRVIYEIEIQPCSNNTLGLASFLEVTLATFVTPPPLPCRHRTSVFSCRQAQ